MNTAKAIETVKENLIHQRDKMWWFKTNGALRRAIVEGAANSFGRPVVLTEYPKSGGSWLSQMLSAALEIPYPRNRFPLLRRQIIHGCYRKVNPKADTIVCWRDGRDTMVSFYYHLVFEKPNTSHKYSQKIKSDLDIKDPYNIDLYLPRFIEWTFEGGYPGFSWADFVDMWRGSPDVVETSYEAVTHDPVKELIKIITYIDPEQLQNIDVEKIVKSHSFESQSNRKRGEEDVKSFIRKGIIGDWKNVFNREACDVFQHYAGKELILLGYEHDNSWVTRQSKSIHANDSF